jgi:hypothetical protein
MDGIHQNWFCHFVQTLTIAHSFSGNVHKDGNFIISTPCDKGHKRFTIFPYNIWLMVLLERANREKNAKIIEAKNIILALYFIGGDTVTINFWMDIYHIVYHSYQPVSIIIHSCIGRFFCYNMGISYRIEQIHISSRVIHIKGSYIELLLLL